MKALSGRELCTPVERQGGTLLRVRGSHHVYGKAGVSVRLIIPVHGGRSLPQGLLRYLLNQAGLGEQDL